MLKFFQNINNAKTQIKYSVNDFIFRYKKIEKITVKEGLDGFLLINGSDAKENSEYTKLTNWLFQGMSGVEIEENEYLAQQFSEMMLFVRKGSAYIYIEKDGLMQIQHLIYSIPNVQVFCPTDQQLENRDELENIKFCEFCKMVKGIKKVGVVLGTKDQGQVKNIEKWPMIQTYGINDFENGFFSLNCTPVDLTQRINHIFKNHDKFSIQKLVLDISNKIVGHFNSSVGIIGDQKIHKRTTVTENQLTEIIKDTYELEEINPHAKKRQDLTLPLPRVLFGKNTSSSHEQLSSNTQLKDCSYTSQFPAFHLTAESSDLHFKIRVARTYFLKRNVKKELDINQINDDQNVVQAYSLQQVENPNYQDEAMLVTLYTNLVILFQEIISHFSRDYKSMTVEFVQQSLLAKLSPVYQEFIKDEQLSQDQLKINLKCYNAFGEEGKIDFKDAISFKLPHYIYILRIEISNIKSSIYKNTVLGSIIVCDTFILQENCYILLTKDVPYLDFFNTDNTFSEKIQNVKQRIVLEELGKQLQAWDFFYEKNRVFIPTEKLSLLSIDIPIFTMKYVLHEKGLRMGDEKLGWVLILFSQMKNIRICKNLPTNWIVFQTEENIVFNALGKQTICLEFIGKAVEDVYLKMINYFDENKIEYSYFNETPQIITESVIAQREILKLPISPKQIRQNQILNHQILLNFLEDKQLMILNQMKDLKLSQYFQMYDNISKNNENLQIQNKIGLIFINGSYASGKSRFAASLKRFGQESNVKLHILKFNLSHLAILDIKNYLQSIISFIKDNKVQVGDIIISVIPYYISTFMLLEYFSKNEKLSNLFYIRTIITKVNVNNFYKNSNWQIVENVTSYGIPGYSQVLILDTYDNYEKDVESLRILLKNIRPEYTIYRLTNNIIYPDVAKDILAQNKFQNDMNVFTRNKLSVFYDIAMPLDYKLQFVKFSVPINQKKLEKYLQQTIMKEMQGYVFNQKELEDKLQNFKNQYKDSKDEFVVEIIKTKEKLDRMNFESRPDTMKLDYIKGIVRYDNQLEEGLFEITITFNYLIERKVRNVVVQMKEETINGKKYKRPVYSGFQDINDVGFLFAGRNLNEAKIQQLLQSVIKDKPVRKLAKTKEQLSSEEIEKIEFDNSQNGLENGEFYDGWKFRDINGLLLPHHPKFDEYIQNYLKEEQIKLDENYKQLESEYAENLKVAQEFLYV